MSAEHFELRLGMAMQVSAGVQHDDLLRRPSMHRAFQGKGPLLVDPLKPCCGCFAIEKTRKAEASLCLVRVRKEGAGALSLGHRVALSTSLNFTLHSQHQALR